MKKLVICLGFILGVCLSYSYSEVKFTPVANISLYGGQYYLDDDPSSFGGNTSIYVSPVINFSPTRALVPVFNVDYVGTRDVQELVGGGTLTRQTMDAGVTLKYVYRMGAWKVKPRFAYKKSLINETKDEKWTKGLFDYDRILYGFGIAKFIKGYEFSLDIDYYNVSFPNYSSLIYEDAYTSSIDTQTYTEISSNAGEDVLDYTNAAVSVSINKQHTPDLRGFYSYRCDLRDYKDQTIVQSDGSFKADKRQDLINTLSLGIEYKFNRTGIMLKNDTRFFDSNQNSFDANATKYIKDFYSYYSTEFTPTLNLYLGKAENLSRLKLWWAIELKKYIGRLAQDTDADYTTDKVSQSDNGFGLSYNYPLFKDLNLLFSLNRRTVSSNMKYEGKYKYNYTVTNYYTGLNWQFH
jgi:hypothetical protein